MNKIPLVFSLALIVLVSGCIQESIEIEGVEIREYQGEKLSSVNDFRENSIKGPQYVDRQRYTLQITGLVENPKIFTYD